MQAFCHQPYHRLDKVETWMHHDVCLLEDSNVPTSNCLVSTVGFHGVDVLRAYRCLSGRHVPTRWVPGGRLSSQGYRLHRVHSKYKVIRNARGLWRCKVWGFTQPVSRTSEVCGGGLAGRAANQPRSVILPRRQEHEKDCPKGMTRGLCISNTTSLTRPIGMIRDR